jgi:prepilin-type N-terminal cleavage/methylation domain-containing protein
MIRHRKSGVSLLEVMIVIAILSLVAGALYAILASASNTYGNLNTLGDAQERARRVMDEMTKELRMADQATLVISTTVTANDTITFQIPEVDASTGLAQLDSATSKVKWAPRIQYAFQMTVLDAVTKLPSVSVDANNNRIADEGRIIRKLETAPRGSPTVWTTPITYDANKQRSFTDFVKQGGLSFTKTGDNIVIEVTFISVDHKNKVIETTLRSSVTLRNSST